MIAHLQAQQQELSKELKETKDLLNRVVGEKEQLEGRIAKMQNKMISYN